MRVLDLREDDKTSVGEVRRRTFSQFDAIIESGSVLPLYDLIRQIAGESNASVRSSFLGVKSEESPAILGPIGP